MNNQKTDTTFYVSAVVLDMTNNSFKTLDTGTLTSAGGIMFDLYAKKEMLLDSLSTLYKSSSPQNISVYMKSGTHIGFETKPASWKLVETVAVYPSSSNILINIPLKKYLTLSKDSLYGFYLRYNAKYSSLDYSYANQDLVVINATALGYPWANLNKNRTFNGKVFYRTGTQCESERVKYKLKVNKAPIIYLGKDTAYCANSGIKLTLDAGNGFAAYKWSSQDTTQIFTVTEEGTYSATITDINGCSNTDKITITKNLHPDVHIGNDTSFCSNAGISYTLDAGPGYNSFRWNLGGTTQTLKVKSAGIYSLIVTNDKNCEASDTLEVSEIKSPVVNLGKDTSFCEDNSIRLLLDAGAGFKNYKWSTSAETRTLNISTPGQYSVIVTDSNACKAGDTIRVIATPNPRVYLGDDFTYCINSGLNKKLDASPGYFYQWSTGDTTQVIYATTPGKYYVGVKDFNNCPGSDTIHINSAQNPKINLGPDRGDSILPIYETLDAGSGYKTYLWSTKAKTQTINVTMPGKYSVIVTDTNDCQGLDTIEIKYEPVSVALTENPKIKVYPNPTNNILNILSENAAIEKLEVFEMNGRLVYNTSFPFKDIAIHTGNWSNGIYMLALTYEGKRYTMKISVLH